MFSRVTYPVYAALCIDPAGNTTSVMFKLSAEEFPETQKHSLEMNTPLVMTSGVRAADQTCSCCALGSCTQHIGSNVVHHREKSIWKTSQVTPTSPWTCAQRDSAPKTEN